MLFYFSFFLLSLRTTIASALRRASQKYHFPNMTSYAPSTTCTGTGTVSGLSEYCQQVTTYPVGDNNHLVSKLMYFF